MGGTSAGLATHPLGKLDILAKFRIFTSNRWCFSAPSCAKGKYSSIQPLINFQA